MFVLVVAKEPVAGRVKTRLCPPCTPDEAATLAAAALRDTMAAVEASGADEIVVALDGERGPWIPTRARVVPQVDAPFDRRLAAAWAATSGPGIQIGMDTPQVTAVQLDDAMALLDSEHHDAVLGPARDGGWWCIGLPAADDRAFHGIPMSRGDTGAHQLARLVALGHRVGVLPILIDVDHYPDALAIAAAIPGSHFAAAVHAVEGVAAGTV